MDEEQYQESKKLEMDIWYKTDAMRIEIAKGTRELPKPMPFQILDDSYTEKEQEMMSFFEEKFSDLKPFGIFEETVEAETAMGKMMDAMEKVADGDRDMMDVFFEKILMPMLNELKDDTLVKFHNLFANEVQKRNLVNKN